MSNRIKFGLMAAVLCLAAACSSEPKQTQPVTSTSNSGSSTAAPATDAEKRDKAFVRVINAVPGGAAFDIFADDQKVFNAVAFKKVTPYIEIPETRHTFRLRQAGQDSAQPLAENSEGLSSGKHYTMLVMPGTNDKTTIQLVSDNITPPPADTAQLRVINASPDAGELDVVSAEGNKKLFSGINSAGDTGYSSVNPMKTTLEVRPEGQDKPVLTVTNANFEKGKLYTIVVTGHAKGSPPLQAVMVEDHLGSGATTAMTQPKPEDAKMVKTKSTK